MPDDFVIFFDPGNDCHWAELVDRSARVRIPEALMQPSQSAKVAEVAARMREAVSRVQADLEAEWNDRRDQRIRAALSDLTRETAAAFAQEG